MDMDEHKRKTLIMLIIIVVIAAIVGLAYYIPKMSERPSDGPKPLTDEEVAALDDQLDSANKPGPGALNPQEVKKQDSAPTQKGPGALTPEQIEALDRQLDSK